MHLPAEIRILDRLLDPIRECLTPEIAARATPPPGGLRHTAQLDHLAERNASGTITADEREECESLVRAGNLIAVLQAKARASLPTRCSGGMSTSRSAVH
jgi:hypothetical protein